MWKEYFGDQAHIYGVDINEDCKSLEEDNITIHIGSQTDRSFLRRLKKEIPPIDILIDDGGHTMRQQRITFEEMYGHVKENGVYLCEDTHTSYILEYGGGLKRKGTFIEYSKNLVDHLNAFHTRQKNFKVSPFTKSADSIHFYDSVVVIEKRKRSEPIDLKSGIESFKYEYNDSGPKTKRVILKMVNKTLQFLRLPGFIWK